MGNTYYNAIVFMQDTSQKVRKYRNIKNLNSFKNFCELQQASYFNLYRKDNKKFVERVYLKNNPV